MRIKQKVRPYWLPTRLAVLLLLISVPLMLSAQEVSDSIHVSRDHIPVKPEGTLQYSPPELLPEKTEISPSFTSGESYHLPVVLPNKGLYLPYHTNPSPNHRGDYRTGGVLKQFTHGTLFGSGGQTSLPGIGRFNDASLGFQHNFSKKLALQLNANAMKINMPHINGQAFSTSGALLYRPTDRLAIKLFGSYDIGNSYGMSTHRYGATLSVDMSDRFGMEMGVQRYYDAMRGRWETVPIVAPYYRFDKFTLGLDVGGIVYEILREVIFDKQKSSPTIGPPRAYIPIRQR